MLGFGGFHRNLGLGRRWLVQTRLHSCPKVAIQNTTELSPSRRRKDIPSNWASTPETAFAFHEENKGPIADLSCLTIMPYSHQRSLSENRSTSLQESIRRFHNDVSATNLLGWRRVHFGSTLSTRCAVMRLGSPQNGQTTNQQICKPAEPRIGRANKLRVVTLSL